MARPMAVASSSTSASNKVLAAIASVTRIMAGVISSVSPSCHDCRSRAACGRHHGGILRQALAMKGRLQEVALALMQRAFAVEQAFPEKLLGHIPAAALHERRGAAGRAPHGCAPDG